METKWKQIANIVRSISISILLLSIAIWILRVPRVQIQQSNPVLQPINQIEIDQQKKRIYELEEHIRYIDTVGDRIVIDTLFSRIKSRLNTD